MITLSAISATFKKTLDNVVLDKRDGLEANLVYPKYLKVEDMTDAWSEDTEFAGGGLFQVKAEGEAMASAEMSQGNTKRYVPRTWAQKMTISDEAEEDGKYPEVIKLQKYLKRQAYKTQEYDAASVLARGWNTSYTGWDALPLFSASHTLASGSTFSNTMSTPLGPSVAAVSDARAACRKMPGLDGFIDGIELVKVVFPPAQETDWEEIVGSKMRPESGNYATINVVKGMGLELVMVPYWTNTDTNYCFITDVENGLKWLNRRKLKSQSWIGNEHQTQSSAMSYRADFGWSNPRGAYGVQA